MTKRSVDWLEVFKECRLREEILIKLLIEKTEHRELIISQHNEQLESACDNRSKCGYAPYKRDCPNCPRDYKIDMKDLGD